MSDFSAMSDENVIYMLDECEHEYNKLADLHGDHEHIIPSAEHIAVIHEAIKRGLLND